jgi:hypothetical protein
MHPVHNAAGVAEAILEARPFSPVELVQRASAPTTSFHPCFTHDEGGPVGEESSIVGIYDAQVIALQPRQRRSSSHPQLAVGRFQHLAQVPDPPFRP